MITAVVCAARNDVIGQDGRLPWPFLEAAANRFRTLTDGRLVVCGRRTAHHLPHALLERCRCCVLTRSNNTPVPYGTLALRGDLDVSHTLRLLHQALAGCSVYSDKDVVVIGGAEVFRAALPALDVIHFTRLSGPFDGDVYFPALRSDLWEITSDGSDAGMAFLTYTRKGFPSSSGEKT